jgi:hypothetical protein
MKKTLKRYKGIFNIKLKLVSFYIDICVFRVVFRMLTLLLRRHLLAEKLIPISIGHTFRISHDESIRFIVTNSNRRKAIAAATESSITEINDPCNRFPTAEDNLIR